MKGFTGVVIAALAAGVLATPHHHIHHQHHHRQLKQRQPEGKGKGKGPAVIVTEVVEGPTVTEYVLGGERISEEEAKKGIEQGSFVVIGESKPSFSAPPPVISTPSAAPTGGQFFEAKTNPPPEAKKTKAPPAPKPKPKPKPQEPAAGIDEDFPSGKVPCSEFPSRWGAIPIPWTHLGGWTTIMKVGKLIKGHLLDNIHQSKDPNGCKIGDICSYACPPGYQKTQWPEESQGATGQSVGGLFCNSEGFLELTRPAYPKICEKGVGGVFVRNELSSNAAVCRTDYPGCEEMNIPVNTNPGETFPLTNPSSKTYYRWQGKPTTAQYYVNNEGVSVEQACTWVSSEFPDSAGNWAPTNVGTGQDEFGITYLSIFPNLPTSHAILNFDIEIEGDYNGECWLRNGQYAKPNGCTVGIQNGKSATLVFKKRRN